MHIWFALYWLCICIPIFKQSYMEMNKAENRVHTWDTFSRWDTICSWTVSQLDCSSLGVPAVGRHPSQAPWSPPPQRPVTEESEDAPHCMGKKPCPDTMFFQGQRRYALLLALCAGLVCSSLPMIHLHDLASYSLWPRSNGGLWAMGGEMLGHVYQIQRTPSSNRVCFNFAT